MKRLIIIGAGGMGREVFEWANHVKAQGADWEIAGFLDVNTQSLHGYDIEKPIIGSSENYEPTDEDIFACAIGDPKTRLKIVREFQARGAEFVNLIHPSAVIGSRVVLGTGIIIAPMVCVTCDVQLGDFAFLNVGSCVGHDAIIGDGCTLSGHAEVTGYAVLGEGVFMGSHSCVHPSVKVGDYAVIGIASAAIRNVPKGTTIIGVPGKRIPIP